MASRRPAQLLGTTLIVAAAFVSIPLATPLVMHALLGTDFSWVWTTHKATRVVPRSTLAPLLVVPGALLGLGLAFRRK